MSFLTLSLNNILYLSYRNLLFFSVFQSCSLIYVSVFITFVPGISVGIVTDYGLDGPGSNPGGDEIFRPSRPALGPTQPPVKLVPGVSRG